MKRSTENKIILVTRPTRLDELISRYNTLDQARFYVEHMGVDFGDYLREHDTYKHSVAKAETMLDRLGRVQILTRKYLPNFIFGDSDLVVVIGQDGLVANTLKYLDKQLVIGVNPDPARWDGVLLPFEVDDLTRIVPETFRGDCKHATVTMGEAELSDGRSLYAVNDFFIGAKSHVSARYRMSIDGKTEDQSSSGVLVSTGLGSTGWLKSVLAGAAGIARILNKTSIEVEKIGSVAWHARNLVYSVREPFPSRTTGTSLVFGEISDSQSLKIESHMTGNGVIFSDGIEADYLEFNTGMTAEIRVAAKSGHLIV
jgi:hypothetical protein